MDLSLFRRAEQRFASRAPASLDLGVLTAMLQARQAASPAARAQLSGFAALRGSDPLVELLLGGSGWRWAAAAQRGSFSPAFARQRSVN
ncbi:MAG TPA: hypothetical protein VF727_09260 [Allosphingosinicella sp.]|jgi:hypothetical protein